jgi:hypothetical protein
MLSNFQFGNQALLQSFLVGQPEFREILQRPEMEQFRQRVAATCHIGPLDLDETRGYIEHRLRCAGSKGKPSFEPAAFEAIFKASGGIPRRINALCDRLLLAGFLSGRTALTLADVDDVVKEFAQENAVSARPAAAAPQPALLGGEPSMPGGLAGASVDVDLTQLRINPEDAAGMSKQLAALTADARGDQLQRLERSLLRLERTNVQILGMLSKLVAGLKKPSGPGE